MELLAPARDLETLVAAVDAGADAVYAGLQDFSARKRATNFTGAELCAGVRYVRSSGRKLYVTVNTLVLEGEMKSLADTLAFLGDTGVDAVIVQDWGVYALAREVAPHLRLHASTQMGTKNALQASYLQRAGFARVVLERQLTLDEIASIADATAAEIEVFVHGALCFALSGCCFFSKETGGRSGNRGDCAQPCRWAWLDGNGRVATPFSPSDMEGIAALPALAAAGVRSLKIEGRMKGADYVVPVVAGYRKALDLLDAGRLDEAGMHEIAGMMRRAALYRRPSKGFLDMPRVRWHDWQSRVLGTGADPGVFIGRITSATRTAAYLSPQEPFSVGDTLRVHGERDDRRTNVPVKAIYANGVKVRDAVAGAFCGFPCAGARAGDAVWLVRRRSSVTKGIARKIAGLMDGLVVPSRDVQPWPGAFGSLPVHAPRHLTLPFGPGGVIDGKRWALLLPDRYERPGGDPYDDAVPDDAEILFVSHPCEAELFPARRVIASPWLYAVNRCAIAMLTEAGCKGFSVAPDSDPSNQREMERFAPLWVRWRGLPVFLTRFQDEGIGRCRLPGRDQTALDWKGCAGMSVTTDRKPR